MDQERIAYNRVAPSGIRAMLQLEQYVKESGLEPDLLDLIRTRVSEINGCAYCIDMHTKDARARGETEQRLYELSAWRDTPFYTDRERAALAWAEAVTLLPQHSISGEFFQQTQRQFTEKELVDLTLALSLSTGGTGSPSRSVRFRVRISQPRATSSTPYRANIVGSRGIAMARAMAGHLLSFIP